MDHFTLSKLQTLLDAKWQGVDTSFQFVSTDTRTLKPGELFIALIGPQFDGHDFIETARERGAIAAIVSKPITTALPTLQVKDTCIALGQLAKLRRNEMNIPVVGITGSCGKTTTKTMLAAILAQKTSVLSTQGTLNNDIGVPLTLLRLTDQHKMAVIEMGANHAGEIAYVASIAQPTIAIITNAAPVHLAGFKTIEGVARAKGELYQGLAANGVAILNIDDDYADFWRTLISNRRCITFGITHKEADIRASAIRLDTEGHPHFQLQTPQGDISIELSVLGEHNVRNALAAAAAALELGLSLEDIKKGLAIMQPVAKRSIKRTGFQGAQLIDDTYNANPIAFRAALQLLAHCQGKKILVMGDMGEMGHEAPRYHEQVGKEAKQYGIHQLYAVGDLSRAAVTAFGEGAQHFASQQALIAAIKPLLAPEMTVLIKGSRSAKMENVVSALLD